MYMYTACAQQSITFATAYDSLGEEGLRHSINEPEAYGIFTQASLLGTLGTVLADTPSIKLIVYDGRAEDVPSGALDALKAVRGGSDDRQLQIYTFDEFVELGKQHPAERHLPQPDDVACIMYTSGSTGAPKGVQITNGNIVACIGAVQKLIGHIVCRGETYIAYLVRVFRDLGWGSCPAIRRLTFFYPPLNSPLRTSWSLRSSCALCGSVPVWVSETVSAARVLFRSVPALSTWTRMQIR